MALFIIILIVLLLGMSSFSAKIEELSLFYHQWVPWSTDYTDTDSTNTEYLYQQGLMIEILSIGGIGVSVVSALVNDWVSFRWTVYWKCSSLITIHDYD
jgi:hypothetical protein